jgi:hypothetical protein
MGGRASSRSIGLASTSHSRAAFAVAFGVAASAWVVARQTTSGPPYGTVRFTNDGLRLEASGDARHSISHRSSASRDDASPNSLVAPGHTLFNRPDDDSYRVPP